MADVSKFNVGGTVYNVKDATARQQISQLNGNIGSSGGRVLWTNPDSTSAFTAQEITLPSTDYDFYEIYYVTHVTNRHVCSVRSIKGEATSLMYSSAAEAGSTNYHRFVSNPAANKLSFEKGNAAHGATKASANNSVCVPLKVIGYKA